MNPHFDKKIHMKVLRIIFNESIQQQHYRFIKRLERHIQIDFQPLKKIGHKKNIRKYIFNVQSFTCWRLGESSEHIKLAFPLTFSENSCRHTSDELLNGFSCRH